jgi:thiamine-phosphate pyrophosphorylase
LLRAGLDGVHLGADDAPPELARELLGPDVLIGLSTHTAADVARAEELPVDYLGFGPIHATETKGYRQGLGAEAAWIAAQASALPVFPIGGIEPSNAAELAEVGRAAVSRAVLAAEDPGAAARWLVELLAGEG